ncbi:paired box protein Pax-2 isoform X7 [Macaca nemestrina]|uniref:paired box protein Pax-2 isoform X19 n=1 Tax=Macaca fascicularis TaxID=9541 RepID=UPI0032B067BA
MEERAGPAVLKLSLRGDTAAAAALLPLLCLPMDMHCKADPFSAMHRCQDRMVIFPCLCLGDALKTKRGSKRKSKSGREPAAQPSRWALGKVQLCSQLWRLLA